MRGLLTIFYSKDGDILHVLVYVDDVIISGNSPSSIGDSKSIFLNAFT